MSLEQKTILKDLDYWDRKLTNFSGGVFYVWRFHMFPAEE